MNIPFGFTPGDSNSDDPNSNNEQKFDMNSLGAMLQQLGSMMQQSETDGETGSVSWNTIRDTARNAISQSGDPSITEGQQKSVNDAVALAQTWVDAVTTFPANSSIALAWSRSEWLVQTLPAWQPLIDPVADGLQNTMADMNSDLLPGMEVPPELKQMLEPVMAMAKKMAAISTGMQLGNGLGTLSNEMIAASDIAAPLSANCIPAILPNAVSRFAEEHELPVSEAMVYIAVREVAFQRLMAANSWLQREIADLISAFARGIEFDSDRIREIMSSVDPADANGVQELMASGIFEPTQSESQKKALNKMEFTLALVEGWVSLVTAAAVADRLANASALNETFLRRQISGGPASKTFAKLVGLELRPRMLRDTQELWNLIDSRLGMEKRDWIWSHPDFCPSADDLQDPEKYLETLKNSEASD